MDNICVVQGITKNYPGKVALRGVDMDIKAGHVVGLLGPNGSGKTTLLKIMAGLLQKTKGSVDLYGGLKGLEAKEAIAFLPDTLVFPSWMRVKDAFQFTKDMYAGYDDVQAEKLQALLDLQPMDKIKNLSKGMQERVALGVTLCRRASLYLLDEPLGGIDPVGKARILDAILAMELGQSSIVVSTHLIRDIEHIFDSIFLLGEGKVLYHGDCDVMREANGKSVEQVYLEAFGYV